LLLIVTLYRIDIALRRIFRKIFFAKSDLLDFAGVRIRVEGM